MAIDPNVKFARLMEEYRVLFRRFVIVELELAATFCDRALNPHLPGEATREATQKEAHLCRNLNNAVKTYESVIRALEGSGQNIETDPEIAAHIRKVRSLLVKLRQSPLASDFAPTAAGSS